MEGTVFTPALEGMKHVKSEQGDMLTKPFLEVCKQILPVIGEYSHLLLALIAFFASYRCCPVNLDYGLQKMAEAVDDFLFSKFLQSSFLSVL